MNYHTITMNKPILSNFGYIIDKNILSDIQLNQIKNDLTVEPFYEKSYQYCDINKNNKFKIYQEGKLKIILPKYYALNFFKDVYNPIIKLNNGIKIQNIEFVGELRDKQKCVINKIKNEYIDLNTNELKQFGGGILSVPPGQGKTVMALYLISLLKVKTLIIVHKTFLVNQWLERIEQYLKNVSVGYIYQNIIDIDKDIVIGMLQSISMKKYDDEIFEDFDLVIFDEVHHLGAKIFSQALLKIQSKYTLGLSATPNRKDRLEKVFYWYLGPLIYYDEPTHNSIVQVNIYNYKLSEPNELLTLKLIKSTKTINYSRMLANLTKIDKRNQFIINLLNDLIKDSNRKILLLSNSIEHIKTLEKELKLTSYGLYIGGMKKDKLKLSETRQIILASYAMASEGLDIKDLNTLILATPKSDIIQSIGRILRKDHNTTIPTIYDIIDNNNVFIAQSKKRLKNYKNNNFNLTYYIVIDDTIKDEKPIVDLFI